MNFFLDENLSPKLIDGLRTVDLENDLFHLSDKFDRGTPDDEWMSALSDVVPGAIVLTGNRGIAKNKVLRDILSQTGHTYFILDRSWMNLGWKKLSSGFIGAWPQICESAIAHPTSTLFRMKYRNGRAILENLSKETAKAPAPANV